MLTPSFEEEICISLFPSVNDALEVSSLQGSATDQATVNFRLCKQFLGIARLAATAVQDAYVLSCFVAELFSNDVADELVHSKTLFQRETEVLSKLDIDPEIFGYIQYGMYGVLYDAASTLKEHWLDSSIVAAAKTGTAQRGEGLVNNAMFILYAPYGDNPEIAIAIAVEKGGAGATLSPVARKIVDYYFTFQSSANTVENAYSLLK